MTERQRRLLVLLAALLGMALTARLGVWQLDRAAQKLALQAAVDQQASLPALSEADLVGSEAQLQSQFQRPVRLSGEWASSATLYLDNRQMAGRPGFFVVTPLRLASGGAVLVQRGWVPRDMQQRSRLQPVLTPLGTITIEGRLAPWPSRLAALGADEQGPIRQNVERETLAAQTGLTLRPFSVVQLDNASMPAARGPAADGLWRAWTPPALNVEKHYGYAAQWFVFCTLIAGLYVWFQLIRPARRSRLARRDASAQERIASAASPAPASSHAAR